MPSLLRTSGTRSSTKNAIGVVLIVVIVATLLSALAYYAFEVRSRPSLDPITFCPPDPQAVTAILIDGTDPLSVLQYSELVTKLSKAVSSVPRYGRLEVYVLEPVSGALLVPTLKVCNPGSPTQADPRYEAPKNAQKKYDAFTARVRSQLERLREIKPADTSPVIEGIRSLAVTAFGDLPVAMPRRLIVASDMLQNSDIMSHYRDRPRADSLPPTGMLAQLEGVEITILYLTREGAEKIQGREHLEFWAKYFLASGAILASPAVDKIGI